MAPLLFSIRVFFISTGVLSLALLLKFSVPLVTEFSAHQAWSSFISWLKPPYLYIVINGIIVIIAASSRFHKNHEEDQPEQLSVTVKMSTNTVPDFGYAEKVPTVIRSDFHLASAADDTFVYEQREAEEESKAFEDKSTVLNGSADVDDEEAFLISRSAWIPPKRRPEITEILLPAEKPLVSTRFGHRKPVKASPEGGRALKVSKPKRHETLENTWKTITEGRAMPLTRHLKKSDTWEHHGRHINVDTEDPPQVKKSETFKDRTNYQTPPETPSPVKLKKEPSLSHDELNRRVEAFISKFNEEMRLQREESLNRYRAMVAR